MCSTGLHTVKNFVSDRFPYPDTPGLSKSGPLPREEDPVVLFVVGEEGTVMGRLEGRY